MFRGLLIQLAKNAKSRKLPTKVSLDLASRKALPTTGSIELNMSRKKIPKKRFKSEVVMTFEGRACKNIRMISTNNLRCKRNERHFYCYIFQRFLF